MTANSLITTLKWRPLSDELRKAAIDEDIELAKDEEYFTANFSPAERQLVANLSQKFIKLFGTFASGEKNEEILQRANDLFAEAVGDLIRNAMPGVDGLSLYKDDNADWLAIASKSQLEHLGFTNFTKS